MDICGASNMCMCIYGAPIIFMNTHGAFIQYYSYAFIYLRHPLFDKWDIHTRLTPEAENWTDLNSKP